MLKSNFFALVFAIVTGTSSHLHSSNGEMPKFKVGDRVTCTFKGFNHSYEFVFYESVIDPHSHDQAFKVNTYVVNEHGRSLYPGIDYYETTTDPEGGLFYKGHKGINIGNERIKLLPIKNTAIFKQFIKHIKHKRKDKEWSKMGKWKYYPAPEEECESEKPKD